MILLGIDPGLDGAFAFLDAKSGYVLAVMDMPAVGDTKREIDAAGVVQILGHNTFAHAFIEFVASSPQQGVASAFKFGKGYGLVLGVLAAQGIPMTFVTPKKWKGALQAPAEKDKAVLRASQLLPSGAQWWTIQRGRCNKVQASGRAEAAMIAEYGRRFLALDRHQQKREAA